MDEKMRDDMMRISLIRFIWVMVMFRLRYSMRPQRLWIGFAYVGASFNIGPAFNRYWALLRF
ncbi:MAG: hypothetical protein CMP47_00465 [Rickettsiales bacterium]|nr:hypothetical protein [Rickettsiales bacterium]